MQLKNDSILIPTTMPELEELFAFQHCKICYLGSQRNCENVL